MIRLLQKNEIHRIMDIWEKSTIKAHDFIEERYWIENHDKVKNVYIPMADTFVYDDGVDIKGFISIIDNEFIGALFVDIEDQGSGIGSKLIGYVLQKYKQLSLAVYKDNISAVEFYKDKGFKVVKEQVNEDSGCKEYIMGYPY